MMMDFSKTSGEVLYVILAGFALSFQKAALEKLVPALLSYGPFGFKNGKAKQCVLKKELSEGFQTPCDEAFGPQQHT